ncbi:DUF305 domain-containing protein [Xylanimonas oleitrophica]|nr:DUF305 domain-containing protein [Xylanimonas oleitrophica]
MSEHHAQTGATHRGNQQHEGRAERHGEAQDQGRQQHHDHEQGHGMSHDPKKMYLRFAAMILTGMVVMYWTMFAGVWEWSHIRFSESRVFMALTMGGAMALVMLAWMLGMYRNAKANVAVVMAGIVLLGGGIALDRSQITVDDTAYMRAMIPHHSLAITRSERAQLEDVRVCELAVEISESQRREIGEMDWLIKDIETNGPATTAEQAQDRPVPDFQEPAERQCP